MAKQRRWLLVIEYVAVASSFVGSVAAVVFQQMIYGLAPVSLSLLLNLLNRPRPEQLIQQVPTANPQTQQLRSAVDSLRSANAKLKQEIQNLVPKQEVESMLSILKELKQQHSNLRQSLVPLQSQLDDLQEQFNKRPELEQIESLTQIIVALRQCIDGLPQAEHLQLHAAELQHQLEQAFAQLSKNSERTEQLEQAIAQLQQHLLDY